MQYHPLSKGKRPPRFQDGRIITYYFFAFLVAFFLAGFTLTASLKSLPA